MNAEHCRENAISIKKEPDKATKDALTESRMEGTTSVNMTETKKDETVSHEWKQNKFQH